jgi:hypothetical protein
MPRSRRKQAQVQPQPYIAPSGLKTWHSFAVLIGAAVLVYWRLHYLILLIAAFAMLAQGGMWCAHRFPLTTLFITRLLRALMRR